MTLLGWHARRAGDVARSATCIRGAQQHKRRGMPTGRRKPWNMREPPQMQQQMKWRTRYWLLKCWVTLHSQQKPKIGPPDGGLLILEVPVIYAQISPTSSVTENMTHHTRSA